MTTLRGVAKATVRCRWRGYDDILGNGDDVTFSVVADDSGSFDMAGLPYGYFSCDGRDPLTEGQSSAVAATVFSVEAVEAALPVGSQPTGVSTTSGARLPNTGGSSTTLMLAILLVVCGAATTATTRRRRIDRPRRS